MYCNKLSNKERIAFLFFSHFKFKKFYFSGKVKSLIEKKK